MTKSSNFALLLRDPKHRRFFYCGFFPTATIFCLVVLFTWSALVPQRSKENFQISGLRGTNLKYDKCKDQCKPPGSEPLPKGIVASTSNLEARPLWGSPKKTNFSKSLFAVAVGIKQKEPVQLMVQKFLASNFVVMLFHYDGVVDEWRDFKWSKNVIHISVQNQTKWWFAKRFLHPDIVAEHDYIFLWDEDLGVEHFDPERYLTIVKDEGLEISQPALDIDKSELHHLITARGRRQKLKYLRRAYKLGTSGIHCDENSSAPPCTGWIEVMAPVFSKAAWRCVWYMIQNDLIHAWGLDMLLGYCAQGDRTKNIGVVDAEYIVHLGVPTLGEPENETKTISSGYASEALSKESSHSHAINTRIEVRRQSYNEYKVFNRRWKRAIIHDECWADPYPAKEDDAKTIL